MVPTELKNQRGLQKLKDLYKSQPKNSPLATNLLADIQEIERETIKQPLEKVATCSHF